MHTTLTRPGILWKLTIAVLVVFAITACDDDDDDGPAPATDPALIDFGAEYFINDQAEMSNGVQLPVLVGDSLFVGVAHSGCSDNHEFELQTRVLSAQRAEIWLFKVTPDEACQAFFQYNLRYRVPFSVLAKEEIVLVSPGFENFQLR